MRSIFKHIISILQQREKKRLFWLTLFDLLIGLFDLIFLAFLLLIINFYTRNGSVIKLSFLPGFLLNPDSLLLIALFLVFFALKNYLAYLLQKSQHHFFYAIASRLSEDNLRTYLNEPYLNFIHIDSSVQIRKINQQPIEFSHYILTNVQQLFSQTTLIVFTIAAILLYHPVTFFLLLVLLLPPVLLLGLLIRKRLRKLRQKIKLVSEKAIQHTQEALAGFVESNVYYKNEFFVKRYVSYQDQLNESIASQQTLQNLPARTIEIFAVFGFLILLFLNKVFQHNPAADLLTIGIFMAASYKIIPGIVKILSATGQIKTYAFILNDLPAERSESRLPEANAKQEIRLSQMCFDEVSFEYQNRPILKKVSFCLKTCDFVGLHAASGRGKTTLIHLLLGFIGPSGGAIMANGQNTNAEQRKHFWKRISYVKQQPFLIHDTILKNIVLSEQAYDTMRLDQVLLVCGLDSFLQQLPEGLNSMIRENGKNISGGQRQRIMLARALYHDFDLLILDEALGELDEASEHAILSKLKDFAGKTSMVLFITHHKKSLDFCTHLIQLDGV